MVFYFTPVSALNIAISCARISKTTCPNFIKFSIRHSWKPWLGLPSDGT